MARADLPVSRPFRTALLALALGAFPATAQVSVQDGAWAVYGGGPGHLRYSPLTQIHAGNVQGLSAAWQVPLADDSDRTEVRSQTTPLYVHGRLFATAGYRRNVVALDPATGELLWRWGMDEGVRLEEAPRVSSGRGVAC